jgi:hypothetical protein
MYRIVDLGKTGAVSFEPWQSQTHRLRELWPNLREILKAAGIHWAIIGGESSKDKDQARYMDLDDVRYLIAESRAAGVKSFLKQLGIRWAVDSNTYGTESRDGKRATEVNAGGNPTFWPGEFRSPKLREYPAVEWKTWTQSPKGTVYPNAERNDWEKWAMPEMECAGNPKHATVVQIAPCLPDRPKPTEEK